MREVFKPSTDERPVMIILGIVILYALVAGFVIYLYFLHRISSVACLVSLGVITLIYLPRFLIIKKLCKKDGIKILDNSIIINGKEIEFSSIKKYAIEERKPAVVFVLNNNLIVYKEAKFHLLSEDEQVSFIAIGSEKIQLLKEFLNEIIS